MKPLVLRSAGPLLAALVAWACADLGVPAACMAGIVTWMALWWISEAAPLAITSLLPLVLFPLCGILGTAETALNYGRDIIFLFLGGFLLALGIERSGLHRRIALVIVSRVGASPARLVLGVMLASGFLSMWINSTAAVLVMLPIALSLVDGLRAGERHDRFAVAMLLAVAYGATIGGVATPVGTPPNLIFLELAKQLLPDRAAIGFGQWMTFGVPFAAVYMLFAWGLLVFLHARHVPNHPHGAADVRVELKELGRMRTAEHVAACFFSFAALLWITGDDLTIGDTYTMPGWRLLTGWTGLSDAGVAIACAAPLFLIPVGVNGDQKPLLNWDLAQSRLPWAVLLLIGSGFALANGFTASGLDRVLGEVLAGWHFGSSALQVGVLGLGVVILSELWSNTAVASLVLPILASTAPAWGLDPVSIMVPATIAASCGFMLPIASPMQAIVFGTGRIPVRSMVLTGVWMDLIGVLLLVLFFM